MDSGDVAVVLICFAVVWFFVVCLRANFSAESIQDEDFRRWFVRSLDAFLYLWALLILVTTILAFLSLSPSPIALEKIEFS